MSADAGLAEQTLTRRKIDARPARVRAGKDFEALARECSDDATHQWGAELDPFGRGQKPRVFEEAAFAPAPNKAELLTPL